MLKTFFHIWLVTIILLNSMMYSVIKVDFEINKAYIIENFCVNKSKPELNCEGTCFITEKLQEEKEKREENSSMAFCGDFGVFVQNDFPTLSFEKKSNWISKALEFYILPKINRIFLDIYQPPKA